MKQYNGGIKNVKSVLGCMNNYPGSWEVSEFQCEFHCTQSWQTISKYCVQSHTIYQFDNIKKLLQFHIIKFLENKELIIFCGTVR